MDFRQVQVLGVGFQTLLKCIKILQVNLQPCFITIHRFIHVAFHILALLCKLEPIGHCIINFDAKQTQTKTALTNVEIASPSKLKQGQIQLEYPNKNDAIFAIT